MVKYLAPGVYVEEVASGARPIIAISSSITAFFGCAPNHAANLRTPTPVSSLLEFRRQYVTEASNVQGSIFASAVEGFFVNGGRLLYVINLGMDVKTLTSDDGMLIDAIYGIGLVAA